MQREMATMALPPMFPHGYMPWDYCSFEEMNLVRDWVKATIKCRGVEEFEKATKGWALNSRAEVARILSGLRENGFYPDRIDENGNVAWGVVLKGKVQVELEWKAEKYHKRGQEIRDSGGQILREF